MSNTHHVYPTGDLIEHDTESDNCLCGPDIETVPRDDGTIGWLTIHHALDGREFNEPDYEGKAMPTEAS